MVAHEVGREWHEADQQQVEQVDPDQLPVRVADEVELDVMADPVHPDDHEADDIDGEVPLEIQQVVPQVVVRRERQLLGQLDVEHEQRQRHGEDAVGKRLQTVLLEAANALGWEGLDGQARQGVKGRIRGQAPRVRRRSARATPSRRPPCRRFPANIARACRRRRSGRRCFRRAIASAGVGAAARRRRARASQARARVAADRRAARRDRAGRRRARDCGSRVASLRPVDAAVLRPCVRRSSDAGREVLRQARRGARDERGQDARRARSPRRR